MFCYSLFGILLEGFMGSMGRDGGFSTTVVSVDIGSSSSFEVGAGGSVRAGNGA